MDRRYMMLENKLCKELDMLEEKYRTGAEMSEGDLRKIDLLAHSMKNIAKYTAMKQAEMGSYENSTSYNSFNMNGNTYGNNAYMNNPNMVPQGRGTSQDMSGHYPMNYPMSYPMYPEDRRW